MIVVRVTLLLCLWMVAGPVNGRNFKLGLLCPKSHIRLGWDITVVAAYKAIETANMNGILTNHTVEIVYRNDRCNNKYGAGMTVALRDEEDVDAYLGPPCSTSTKVAGLLAAFWNRPMFTHGATDPAISDKSIFSTVVRVAPAFTKMSAGVAALVKYFGWRRVVMISSRIIGVRDVFCDYAARSIEKTLRGSEIYLAEWVVFNSGIDGKEMDDMLERIGQRGRIVLMCAKKEDEHNILLAAQERGMTNSEYLYISLDHIPPDDIRTPWAGISDKNKPKEAQLFQAYRSVLQMSLASVNSRKATAFKESIPQWMSEAPTFYNKTLISGKKASTYSLFLHDIVYLYMMVVEDTLNKGQDPRNGELMFENAKHKQFEGITGQVVIDSNGDRDPNYWVYYLNTEDKIYDRVSIDTPGRWLTLDGKPPPDTPICGYLGEKCTSARDAAIGGGVGASAVVTIALVIGYIFYRRRKMEEELRNMLWRIKPDDVNIVRSDKNMSITSQRKAVYKGAIVMMQPIDTSNQIQLTREDHLELNAMRQMTHDNVNTFVGACIDPPTSAILMAFCSRGFKRLTSENELISYTVLTTTLLQGLQYVHSSLLKSHGFLTSDTCYVDNRWVVKISAFGVQRLRRNTSEVYEKSRDLMWTAPELLRQPEDEIPRNGTPRADVYSYGIICRELTYRDLPYDISEMPTEEIIEKVKAGPAEGEAPFRPELSDCLEEGTNPGINTLITSCWAEDPGDRPSLSSIRKSLKAFNKGKNINIMDNLLSMMEKYANNLEEIVQQRTSELVDEKKKTDMLLYSMLPRTVADQLKSAGAVEPETFDECTIFFSDIVGFTSLSSESTPLEVVVLLNDLYTLFDGIIAMHDVYKVETIGDAYMVVSGIPLKNGNKHVGEISTMALDLLNGVHTKFVIRHRPDKKLRLRIGLHTGPCVTGVVGLKMPRYCLFGDTVNMASRMESNGEALKIHMSQNTYHALQLLGGYVTKCRGEMSIKVSKLLMNKHCLTTTWHLPKRPGYQRATGLSKFPDPPAINERIQGAVQVARPDKYGPGEVVVRNLVSGIPDGHRNGVRSPTDDEEDAEQEDGLEGSHLAVEVRGYPARCRENESEFDGRGRQLIRMVVYPARMLMHSPDDGPEQVSERNYWQEEENGIVQDGVHQLVGVPVLFQYAHHPAAIRAVRAPADQRREGQREGQEPRDGDGVLSPYRGQAVVLGHDDHVSVGGDGQQHDDDLADERRLQEARQPAHGVAHRPPIGEERDEGQRHHGDGEKDAAQGHVCQEQVNRRPHGRLLEDDETDDAVPDRRQEHDQQQSDPEHGLHRHRQPDLVVVVVVGSSVCRRWHRGRLAPEGRRRRRIFRRDHGRSKLAIPYHALLKICPYPSCVVINGY
ncbi:hypothetical protein LSH36_72g00037 [Paralvinella palmiformis]|uniref:Guanylate cyclase n=1 Tax=Paralvinella palmiformis TaxID=53620 RepID=A0AAD9K3J2_9ANNE|nr:hypothetical protein LSH36_72g00037 [Paralvinella palmiformis]